MHDGVIQELFAVGLTLQAAKADTPDGMRNSVDSAVANIDEAMNRLRAYIFDMPTAPTELRRALRNVIENSGGADNVRLEVEGDLGDLDAGLTDNIEQFVREAVSNAVRHASATEIVVRAERHQDSITVEVQDNGDGFDPTAETAGMGLSNLRNRVESLNGSCEVVARPGRGAVIRADIPL